MYDDDDDIEAIEDVMEDFKNEVRKMKRYVNNRTKGSMRKCAVVDFVNLMSRYCERIQNASEYAISCGYNSGWYDRENGE